MVAQVRRFNRAVTQRVGALDDSYLARGRPLGEARVLWEIGEEGCEVRALRTRLGLDSGHTSRLLRSLERAGLVEVTAGAADRRARTARLTEAGLAEREVVDRRSDELARSFLEPLTASQRERLVGAMREVERLLTAALVEIREVDPTHPDARQCLRSYFAELDRRSDTPFDPTTGSTAEPDELRPPAGVLLVVYLRGAPIGCGALKHYPDSAVRHQAHVGCGVGPRARDRKTAPGGARGAGRRARRPVGTPGDERRAHGGDRALPLRGLRRGTGVQRRALRAPLVREDPPVAIHQGGLMHTVIRAGELRRSRGGTITFEGESHGSGVSFFLVDSEPGAGPGLHRHPYSETWVVRSGTARFTAGGEELEAGPGDIIVVGAETPHKFVNAGPGQLDIVCIHASPVMIQENLEE